jgi:serine/threonine protein kinase
MELVDLSIRYIEEGALGKGGFGEVVLATDTRLNRQVAIKRIQGKVRRSKTAVQRFLTEGQIIAGLSHSNVVQIFDYGWSTDGPYLIMEYVPGGSLLEKCKAGPIELGHAINIFTQLCDGLSKVHAASIIHRDIKPANVLITEDGIPKLTDFGLAKDDTADTGKTKEGTVIGTLDYMPPEQRQAAELTDHRSDLWSLAATFYQMLTGEPPRVIDLDSVPLPIRPVLAKALKSKREDRYQSAMEMREAILQAHSGKIDRSRTLAEGECPQCATPNPADQKFCRDCSAQLQVNCLGCQKKIGIWDNGCGACGAQQTPLLEKTLGYRKQVHDDAERLLVDLEFEAATNRAASMLRETDARLQQYEQWREEFAKRLEHIRQTEYSRLSDQLREAIAHEIAYDYEAGLQTLGQVAPSLKQTNVSGNEDAADVLTERLTTKLSRLKELEGIVRERASKREITGLLPIVNELLTLKPDHLGVLKLKAQLEKRETSRLSQVQQEIEDTQNMQAKLKLRKATTNHDIKFLTSLAVLVFVGMIIGIMYSIWHSKSWFRAVSLSVLVPLFAYQSVQIYRRAISK